MEKIGYLLVLLFTIANALEYLLIKAAGLNTYISGMIMFGTASIFLGIVLFVRRKNQPSHYHVPLKKVLVIGVISFVINILWLKGLEYTSATNASLLGKTDIAFSMLFSLILLRERIHGKTLLFIGLMVVGIVFVMQVKFSDLSSLNIGDVFVIVSAMLLAFNAFLVRKVLDHTSPFKIALINCLVNVLGFAIVFFFKQLHTETYAAKSIILTIIAGFVCFLFFCGYYPSLKIFPLWKVRALALLIPIFTVVGDLFFLHEKLTLSQLGGIGLVLLGVLGIILYEKKKSEKIQRAYER